MHPMSGKETEIYTRALKIEDRTPFLGRDVGISIHTAVRAMLTLILDAP